MVIETQEIAGMLRRLLVEAAKAGAEEALAKANLDDKWLTVEQAAEMMQVNKQTVYSAIESGEIPAHHVGRTIRLRWSEICDATKRKPH